MSDMYFKSLPDTSTPLIPSNLDKLNDIKVSPTQPETNEKVWIQKGKNLLSRIISGYEFVNSSSGNINTNNEWFITDFIPIESGSPYYSQGFSVNSKWWFDKEKNFISCIEDNPGIAPSNAKYLRLNGKISDSSDMMVFQGTEATEYEAYVKKKIKTKNSNGEFETIYDENDLTELQERPNPANYGIGVQCKAVSGDWNTACGNGTGFYMGNELSNAPFSGWIYVIHMVHNEFWAKQIAMPFTMGNIWVRNKADGIWSAWAQLH